MRDSRAPSLDAAASVDRVGVDLVVVSGQERVRRRVQTDPAVITNPASPKIKLEGSGTAAMVTVPISRIE